MYTGLLCKHSILVAVNRMKNTRGIENQRMLCERVVECCNSNWKRKTYETIPKIHVCAPPKPNVIIKKDDVVDNQRLEFISRFREIINHLDPDIVHDYLRDMETKTLQPIPMDELVGFSPPEDDTISSESDVLEYENPPKRRKKKLSFEPVV